MKKHFVLIMNIVLAVLIIGALGFTTYRMFFSSEARDAAASDTKTSSSISEDASTAEKKEIDPSKKFKVGIVQHYNNADSNDCYAGFISELKEQGLIENLDVVYVIEEDKTRCKEEIQRLIDEKCDLLCTIGPYASKLAASLTTDIPIVFAGIADPEKEGLVKSNEKPGGNVTGVSSYSPTFEQVDLISTLRPQTKKLATVYSSTDVEATTQAILAVNKAEEAGMTAEKYPVNKTDDLKAALASIKKAGTQAVFLPADSFILKNIAAILRYTNAIKIPVFVGNETMLKQGAFATCTVNYVSVGRVAAGMCYDILFEEKNPATLSVVYKHDSYNLVNQAALDTLGIQLNQTMQDQVEIKDYSKKEQ